MAQKVKPHQHDHSGMKVSIFLSTLCLIHCLTFPFLIVLLPIFNLTFHPPAWIEFVLLGSTAVLGYYSMRHGLTLHYQNKGPLILFTLGLIGAFVIHIFWHNHQLNFIRISLEVSFALMIAVSQILNYRLTNSHACTTEH